VKKAAFDLVMKKTPILSAAEAQAAGLVSG